MMPAQSSQLCDPAYLADPSVPDAWWPAIRESLPAYDSRTAVAAAFAADAGLVRSGRVGRAEAALLPQRPLVDYAADRFGRHRDRAGDARGAGGAPQ